MNNDIKVRWGWLKLMYSIGIVVAASLGLGVVLIPNIIRTWLGWPSQDPVLYGVMGSVWIAFAVGCVLGLRSPLKFVPVLFLCLIYKCIWFAGVFLPLLVRGQFPLYGLLYVIGFGLFVIGNLIALPFPYVFAKETKPEGEHISVTA